MSQAEVWTIGRLLTWTTDFLKQHGSESPRLDAEVLLAKAKGCQRIQLYTAFDQPADDITRTAFRELVKRRAEGMPVAYLVGQREFFSLPFRVSPDVLIPRPETETMVVRVIDLVNQEFTASSDLKIADVGTGSGIIAITVAKHLPNVRVTALDSSAAALGIARQNAAAHVVLERIEFVESDLFAKLPAGETFNIIVSNPPYVSEPEFATLLPSVRDFEPRLALVSGPMGTEIVERLVIESQGRLRTGGWLLIEISPMIEAKVRQIISSIKAYELHAILKDSAGLPRVVQAKRI
jgi:release factor glutamine methyltransferase